MRFTQKHSHVQYYANLMGHQLEVSGQLMIRDKATWCDGMTKEECQKYHIVKMKYAHYNCPS